MAQEQEAYDELCCYTLGLRDPQFLHQHVVDAYAAQHADATTRPIRLTFALVGLYLLAARRLSGKQIQRVHTELARHQQSWPNFPLPLKRGSITVTEVMKAPPGREREAAIRAWCASVWEAYRESHAAVAELLRRHGGDFGGF